MPRDSGGWRSVGQRVTCPHCTNDSATLIETIIYGKKTKTLLCNVCSGQWEEPHGDSER